MYSLAPYNNNRCQQSCSSIFRTSGTGTDGKKNEEFRCFNTNPTAVHATSKGSGSQQEVLLDDGENEKMKKSQYSELII
jgi:hypothetical protein